MSIRSLWEGSRRRFLMAPYVSVKRVSLTGPRYSEGVTSPLKLMSG